MKKVKFTQAFLDDLYQIISKAAVEKNGWIGKNIQEISCEHLQERGLDQSDIKDTVVLTVQEACEILDYLSYLDRLNIKDEFLNGLPHSCKKLLSRIEQTEVKE